MTRSNALSRSIENRLAKIGMSLIGYLGRGKSQLNPPSGSHRALICKWCCMGDAILSLYAIREFKQKNPGIALEMLVSSRIAEVYRESPDIDRVHVLPVTGRRLLLELFNPVLWYSFLILILTLRKSRFAQFIDLELYRGTGPFLKRLIGIPYSRGFQIAGAIPKGHDFEAPRGREMPEWQCFYLVLGLEISSVKPQALYPRIQNGLPYSRKRIGIVYGASFNWPQKQWPWEYFAETISLLSSDLFEFVLFGSPLEKPDALKILGKAVGTIRDTTGLLDFSGLKMEVAGCDLILGNDTGTLHLAAACNVPCITLFGPTDPHKWNGLTSTPMFLEALACRPCYYLGSMPPCDHFSCLRKLSPGLIADKVRSVLLALEETSKP
jgi:heptosyltransferase II